MGISLGLVGLGAFGSEFADLFVSHPLVDRIALCDREPERVARFARKKSWRAKFNPRDVYTSLDEICQSDLDALAIITQPWLHAPQCIQAMEAGKHVYSAVPIIWIPDGEEILEWCDRLVETVQRTGQHYMLGETTFYRPQAMYCRRRAAEGAFGRFVYSEGEYYHDYEGGGLAEIMRQRMVSKAGREWAEALARYANVKDGPMHYPTHSTSGPISVMGAHAARVSAWPFPNALSSVEPEDGEEIWNETGLFLMSNGATMRIIEYRKIGHTEREIFRIYGTDGSFENDTWVTCRTQMPLSIDEMRDPLPPEVEAAFRQASGRPDFGGAWTADAMRRVAEALAGDRMSLEQAWQAAPAMMAAAMANRSVHSNAEAVPPTRERLLETFDHLLDELTFYGGHGGSHAYLVHEFVDAVAHDRVPAINVWEAVRYMAAGVMAHQSALRDGEMLEVPDWGDAPLKT